jgi:hypothetical protein
LIVGDIDGYFSGCKVGCLVGINLGKSDGFFAFIILASYGWRFCLPVGESVPYWLLPIQVVHGVFMNEAIFIAYLGLRLCSRGKSKNYQPARIIDITCKYFVGLAVWCAIVSWFGSRPFMDAAEAVRMILLVILLIVVTQWAVKDPVFVLRAFLLGLVASTLLNLIYTFRGIAPTIGVLPTLMGQNGPGTSMGIAVCLSAWLALISTRRIDISLALVSGLACSFGAGISFSKIAMGASLAGICCMTAVILFKSRRTGGKILRILAILVCACISIYLGTAHGSEVIESLNRFIYIKSNTLSLATNQSEQSSSNQMRCNYYLGVAELVMAHPLGVGFSGFYDAYTSTDSYLSGYSSVEDRDRGAEGQSNPHSTLLYYLSAGGFVGGGICLLIFFLLWLAMFRGLEPFGIVGMFVAILTGLAFLVAFLTVPTMLNTGLMLIPAAVAVGYRYHRNTALLPTMNVGTPHTA